MWGIDEDCFSAFLTFKKRAYFLIKLLQKLFKPNIFFGSPQPNSDMSPRNEKNWLRLALDKLPKPLFLLNLEEKKIEYFNEAAKGMMGLDQEQFDPKLTYGRLYQAFDPKTGLEHDVQDIPTSRILRGENLVGEEYIIQSKVGRFHLKIFSEKIPRSFGQPESAIILFQDITALKGIENQLRETQDTLNKAVEVAQIGFWKYDPDSETVVLSPILMEQFGIDPNKFDHTLNSALQHIHPMDRQSVSEAISRAISEHTPYQISYRVLHPPGQLRWIEAHGAAIYDKDGKIESLTGTTIDITSDVITRDLIRASKEAVEHERNNFRILFKQTPEMVCMLSGPEHRFVFVNEAHKRILGFDATGKTLREAQPESVEIFSILDEVYRTGITAELSEIPVTVTDRTRYFNLTYAARRDLDSRIDGVMMLGTEVTDEVLSREGLELQREALKLALNDAPLKTILDLLASSIERQTGRGIVVSILLADEDEKHLLHGTAPSLPVEYNHAVHGIQIGPQVGSCGSAAYYKLPVIVEDIENDPRWSRYKEVATKLGYRSCWSTPILSAQGKLLGTIALYCKVKRGPSLFETQVVNLAVQTTALIIERQNEMDDKQASSAALQESELELKFALESARFGTWSVDFTRNGLVSLSSKAQEIFGVTKGYDLPEEAIQDFIHPEDRAHATEVLQHAILTGKPYEDSYRVVLKNGEIRWVELRGRLRYTETGDAKFLTGLVMDVTDRKVSEAQLQFSKQEAERANAAKSQFLANMSHEIRTPIGAILGFSSLLKDEGLDKPERSEFLSVIERNTNQLLRIIDDILDLSKVEAGMMAIEKIDFSLIELLTDVSSVMGLKAREKGILFLAKAETPLPRFITTDPTRLRQILINILGNAIKFTDLGKVELRACYQDGVLQFEVEDTGRGISVEQELNLFKPFTQADSSITRKYGGTGLGLALTKRLAEVLGGRFYLKSSQVGEGSTFAVHIKVKVPQPAEFVTALGFESKSTPSFSSSAQLEGLKVLLVEDSPDNQALFSIYLERAGAKVEIASDGSQGYEMAMGHNYDIILMDVQMPIMDGITAIQKLRANGYQKVVIALTAHAMKDERDRCLEAGFTDFLSKPVRRLDLIEILMQYQKQIK